MVEIGIWSINGHYDLFLSHEWIQIWLGPYPLFPPRLSVFGLIQDIHISSTLPNSHYKYIKGLDEVETGIHPPQPSP